MVIRTWHCCGCGAASIPGLVGNSSMPQARPKKKKKGSIDSRVVRFGGAPAVHALSISSSSDWTDFLRMCLFLLEVRQN